MIKPAEYSIESRWSTEDPADNDFDVTDGDEPLYDDTISAVAAAEILGLTEKFFLEDSPLAEAEKYGGRAYEYRPQQAEMARRTAEALIGRHNLCVEAPTGVGKSFAYLLPLIYYSQTQSKPVLISTETINLQEQLIDKDIPILAKLTGVQFKAALAKGRGNYLCLRKLEELTFREVAFQFGTIFARWEGPPEPIAATSALEPEAEPRGLAGYDLTLSPAFLAAATSLEGEAEAAKIPAPLTWFCDQALVFAQALPDDPLAPEALSRAVRSSRNSNRDTRSADLVLKAFRLLHQRYPNTSAARDAKVYH